MNVLNPQCFFVLLEGKCHPDFEGIPLIRIKKEACTSPCYPNEWTVQVFEST